jgi:hypothetical protein
MLSPDVFFGNVSYASEEAGKEIRTEKARHMLV